MEFHIFTPIIPIVPSVPLKTKTTMEQRQNTTAASKEIYHNRPERRTTAVMEMVKKLKQRVSRLLHQRQPTKHPNVNLPINPNYVWLRF